MHPMRLIKLQAAGISTHRARTTPAGPSYPRYPASFRDIIADDMIVGISDNHIAVGLQTQMLWSVERRFERIPSIPRKAFAACSRHRTNFPVALDHSQGMAASFQNIDASF